MSRRTQNPWTPESKTGVNYFKHQTKHFLTPYGKTHGLLTSREILYKLYHWNCEWLTRPNYAISELADTIYSNLATLADYKDKVFTKHAVDPLLNKAQPIRSVLQRFNKKDSATSEEPNERDLRDLMKFVEDDTLKGLCKHLLAASGAMFSVATHIMTLETLFSHPAEYAKRHRESPEVQSFKQNPSRESMVAYIASQTLSHTEAVAEDEPAGSIWDTLTQRGSSRQHDRPARFGTSSTTIQKRKTQTMSTMMSRKKTYVHQRAEDKGARSWTMKTRRMKKTNHLTPRNRRQSMRYL